jgi:hypothetical protein
MCLPQKKVRDAVLLLAVAMGVMECNSRSAIGRLPSTAAFRPRTGGRGRLGRQGDSHDRYKNSRNQ